jgi:DNA-binding NarL/FixJ family response regulator
MIEDPVSRAHEILSDVVKLVEELEAENNAFREGRMVVMKAQKPKSNRPKLTDREVRSIRAMHRKGVTQHEIADIYDIHNATVSRIVRGIYHRKGA